MTTTRSSHVCTYFDDGGTEHLCDCGVRAVILEEDGIFVVLDEEASVTTAPATLAPPRELAVSA